nr:MAG TPA: hypothetical protein [Bacteriophage sp.]
MIRRLENLKLLIIIIYKFYLYPQIIRLENSR